MTKIRTLAAVALAVGIVMAALSGCGNGDDAQGVAELNPGADANAQVPSVDRERQIELYRDCLVRNGVTLLDHPTEEGLPQVDKSQTDLDVVSAASEECRELMPSGLDAAELPDAADLAARQRHAACIREHGVPEYPDPDPRTGDPRISDELAARLKDDPDVAGAMEACQGILGTTPIEEGVVGG